MGKGFFKIINKKDIMIWILTSICLILFLFLLIKHNYEKVPYAVFIKKMFVKDGNFEPATLTAIAALVGLFITTITSIVGIKMNIINTERARWLSNHKEIMADYIDQNMKYLQNVAVIIWCNYDDLKYDTVREANENAIKAIQESQKKYYLLKLELNVNNNTKNKELMDAVDKVNENINIVRKVYIEEKKEVNLKKIKDIEELCEIKATSISLEKLTNIASNYYKDVWKQIKS